MRQEKQEALALISSEIKRFDAEEIQIQLGQEVDKTVHKINKEQHRDMQEERHLVSRLQKVDHLVTDLQTQESTQKLETQKMKETDASTL